MSKHTSVSILADINEQLESGDSLVINNAVNEYCSEMRKAFSISIFSKHHEKPFEFYKENNKYCLNIYNDSIKTTVIDDNIGFAIKDVIGESLNELNVICNSISIISDNIDKNIAKTIKCPYIRVISKNICNVNLYAISNDNTQAFPIISFSKTDKIHNCNFEIEHNTAYKSFGRLIFYGKIPEFKNVNSESITDIYVSVFNDEFNTTFLKFEKWNNFFEFDYDLNTNNGIKHISDMTSLNSLVSSNKKHMYNEFPYKLKKDSKITEILDVSNFNNLNIIDIYGSNLGICFFKNTGKKTTFYFRNMLKPNWNLNEEEFMNSLPRTSDGWSVLLYKTY